MIRKTVLLFTVLAICLISAFALSACVRISDKKGDATDEASASHSGVGGQHAGTQSTDNGVIDGDFRYVPNEDGESYTVYCSNQRIQGSDGVLEIPDKFNGKPVTKIGDHAFEKCNITRVILGDLEEIGEYAFYRCVYLVSVDINGDIGL